ncbi:hypothetical protein ACOSQ2_028019 [Xanthoceras sorbifolium]
MTECFFRVPTVYPFDTYVGLTMVDTGEEEIFLDTTICAIAFRVLRVHGYDVSAAIFFLYRTLNNFRILIYRQKFTSSTRDSNGNKKSLYCIAYFSASLCASSLNFGNEDFQKLAVDDFNICQSIYHEELKHLDRWVVDKIGQAKICLTEDGLLLLLCGSYPHLS